MTWLTTSDGEVFAIYSTATGYFLQLDLLSCRAVFVISDYVNIFHYTLLVL